MKRFITLSAALIMMLSLRAVDAAAPMRSMTLGGATGLIAIPTARVAWETGNFGINFGYHNLDDDGRDNTHLPKASITLFNRLELGGTYDTQEENGEDTLFHAKLRFFPWSKGFSQGGSSLAIGVNHQELKGPDYTATQIYLAATNRGTFLGLPAETSFAVGKTITEDENDDVDFGIGFNMALFPSVFRNYVNWIVEYGNFSYSLQAYAANASYRGVFNTGVRLDILKGMNMPIHWKIDLLFLDALDDNRSWGIGTVVGIAF